MKQITLTKGYVALVSEEDFERINKLKWFANKNGRYIRAARCKWRTMIYIHHEVLGIMPWELNGKEIDHIDGNPLNNCRENLRIVTHEENMRNSHRHIERIGYSYNEKARLWMVYLDMPGKKRKHLGYTKTKLEAEQRIAEARRREGLSY